MSELLLHIIIELLQVDLEGIILEVIVRLEVLMLQHGLVYQPEGKCIAENWPELLLDCLLYTSDAADDLLCVALGGRRIL